MGNSSFVSSRKEVVSPKFFLFLIVYLCFCCHGKTEPESECFDADSSSTIDTSSSPDEASRTMPHSDSLSVPAISLIEKMWRAQLQVELPDSASGHYHLSELFPVILAGKEIHFGQVEVYQQKVQLMRVANIGSDELKISWVDLPYGFSIKLSSAIILPGKAFTYIPIQFNPLVPKHYRGVMYIRSNANNGTFRVLCEGTGVALPERSSAPTEKAVVAGEVLHTLEVGRSGESLPVVVPANLPYEAPLINLNQSYAVSVNTADYSAAPPIGGHSRYGGYVRGFWLAVRIPSSQLRIRIRISNADSQVDPVIGVKSNPSGSYLRLSGAFANYCDELGPGGDESCVTEGSDLLYIRIYHCDDSRSPRALFVIRVEPAGV